MMLDNLLHKFDYVRIMHEKMANSIDVQAIRCAMKTNWNAN